MLKVVCGIICDNEKVFLCRRKPEKSLGGYWEFPGGKVEPGESCEAALKRELQEELEMQVEVVRYLATSEYHYPDFSIELIAYLCFFKGGDIQMSDHDDFVWVAPEELLDWKLSPADVPLVSDLLLSLVNKDFGPWIIV